MHSIDRDRVRAILHDYKKECYQLEHSPDPNVSKHTAPNASPHPSIEKARDRLVQEILETNFHYHFRQPPNPQRAELIGMIENYTREAVLPPVLSKLVQRIVVLEKRQEAGVRCMERLIELIEESLEG